jgi:hypothetical protein
MAAKRPGALMLGVGVALSLLPGPAPAHDHTPPRVVLRSPGDGQVGRPWSYEWTARESENTCSGVSGDGIPNYQRRAMTWRPKRRIHLRLYKRHKPTGLVIRMYVRLSDSANPAGRGRRADYRLRRTRLPSGRRIWIAGFVGRRDARRHLYLDVTVRYRDVEGCGGSQNMVLAFHLRRRGTQRSLLSSLGNRRHEYEFALHRPTKIVVPPTLRLAGGRKNVHRVPSSSPVTWGTFQLLRE